jgi:hypothetical protein
LPTFGQVKGIARLFIWLKCLGGIMHLKSTAGCQISILIFDPDNTFKLAKSGQELCRSWYIFHGIFIETPPPQFSFKYQNWYFGQVKGIARVFNWLKCLGGIMHLTPTSGCQISYLIFEKKLWRGVSS